MAVVKRAGACYYNRRNRTYRMGRRMVMQLRYKLAVFDMDGTLLDTLTDLGNALNYSLQVNGYPQRTVDETRRFVGNGIHKLVERGVPEGTSPLNVEKVYHDFLPWYQAHCEDNTHPYPGIIQMLQDLKHAGVRTAVVSNKADPAVHKLAGHYFPGCFDISAGDRPDIAKKPAPDMVNHVLTQLNIDRADTVYIGDSDVDILTAANSGMDHIIVTWGFRSVPFLKEHGAKVLAESPDQIVRIITGQM